MHATYTRERNPCLRPGTVHRPRFSAQIERSDPEAETALVGGTLSGGGVGGNLAIASKIRRRRGRVGGLCAVYCEASKCCAEDS